MKDGQYDMDLMRRLEEYGSHLKSAHAERDSMCDDMQDIYLMDWDEQAEIERKLKNIKVTISPDARNAVVGAIRLLTSTEPMFSVPVEENKPDAKAVSERLENMAAAMWRAAGRVRGDPVHYDLVRSAVLFGEFYISVTSTKDLVEAAKGASKAALARAERVAQLTPYLFDVLDPRTVYPDWDVMGLRALYRESDMLVGDILDQFGEDAALAFNTDRKGKKADDYNRYEEVTLCDFWDLDVRQVWVRGHERPILQAEHGLPFIPFAAHLVEGSRLFEDPEDQRNPLLYTMWKSEIWKRQNLALTLMSTMVFGMGATPLFVEEMGPQGGETELDFSQPGGRVRVPYGNKFYPMVNKGIIDPALRELLEIADTKGTESTLYKTALGQPMGSNAPYSMVSLVSQQGRLPLVVAQAKSGWGIADAVKMALLWMRNDKGSYKARDAGMTADLRAQDIPEYFEIEAKLDIDLPQDTLQNANVANLIVQAGLASKRWAQENIMRVGQSEAMQEEIWSEQAAELAFQAYLQEQQARRMQQAQPQQAQPQQGGAGLQGGLPPEMAMGAGAPLERPRWAPPGPAGNGGLPPEMYEMGS